MFRTSLILILILATYSEASFADDPTASPPPTPKATRHGGKLGGKIPNGEKRAKARHDVTGKCTVLETPLNPISGACVSVPLELKDAKGTSLGITRTNAQGEFDFAIEEEGPYKLAPSSSYYVVVSPLQWVVRGQRVDLKIKGKS
jgi:hypothetical protein